MRRNQYCENAGSLIYLGQIQRRSAILSKYLEFPWVARFGAFIAGLLFVSFAFVPVIPFTMLGVAMTPEGLLMARRMSALFLGIAILLFLLRDAEDSPMRRSVSAALSAAMAALAAFGFFDWLGGRNGPGVFIAISVEVYFAVTLAMLARRRGQ